jgi:hypothetical protein
MPDPEFLPQSPQLLEAETAEEMQVVLEDVGGG